jgi:hypothetical protein
MAGQDGVREYGWLVAAGTHYFVDFRVMFILRSVSRAVIASCLLHLTVCNGGHVIIAFIEYNHITALPMQLIPPT